MYNTYVCVYILMQNISQRANLNSKYFMKVDQIINRKLYYNSYLEINIVFGTFLIQNVVDT